MEDVRRRVFSAVLQLRELRIDCILKRRFDFILDDAAIFVSPHFIKFIEVFAGLGLGRSKTPLPSALHECMIVRVSV